MGQAPGLRRSRQLTAIALLGASTAIACGSAASTAHDSSSASNNAALPTTGTGGDTVTAPSTTAVALVPHVWQMTGKVRATSSVGIAVNPELDFELDLSKSADGQDFPAVIGNTDSLNDTTAHAGPSSYELEQLPGITLTGKYSLAARDLDHDGYVDELAGTATGVYTFIDGTGLNYPLSVAVDITGVPDVTSPSLLVRGVVDPVVGLVQSASEPLQATASLSLTGTGDLPLTFSLPAQFSEQTILPFGGNWKFAGSARDLAGNLLLLDGAVQTLADPGVFPQDGFEGSLVAAVESGTAQLVTSVGTLSALHGAKSLLLAPGSVVLLHLVNDGSATQLSFSACKLGEAPADAGNRDWPFQAGVVGGTNLVDAAQLPAVSPSDVVELDDARWQKATAVQVLHVALPSTPGDVLVRFAPPIAGAFGAPPPDALMIDDLKLE